MVAPIRWIPNYESTVSGWKTEELKALGIETSSADSIGLDWLCDHKTRSEEEYMPRPRIAPATTKTRVIPPIVPTAKRDLRIALPIADQRHLLVELLNRTRWLEHRHCDSTANQHPRRVGLSNQRERRRPNRQPAIYF